MVAASRNQRGPLLYEGAGEGPNVEKVKEAVIRLTTMTFDLETTLHRCLSTPAAWGDGRLRARLTPAEDALSDFKFFEGDLSVGEDRQRGLLTGGQVREASA